MDKRTAKRCAHKIVALMINQVQDANDRGWSEDDQEHELIKEALNELSMHHWLIGAKEELP